MKSYDKKINQLIAMYVRAEKNLVNTISQKKYKGQVTDFYEAMLKQVKLQLMQLQAKSVAYSKDIVNELYLEAYYNSLKNLGISDIGDGFAQLHTKAIEVLSDNIINNFAEVNNQVGRRIEDTIRDIGLTNTQMKFATGQTIRQLQNELIDNLVNTGLGGITDKRGRVIPFTTYAELLARSIVAETQNTSVMNVAKEHKKDLVKMTKHNTACTVCQEYEGKIYSISGKSEKYPALKSIPGFSKGYNNIHPRCRHRLSVFIEKYSDEYIKKQEEKEKQDKINNNSKNKKIPNDKEGIKKYFKDELGVNVGNVESIDEKLLKGCAEFTNEFLNKYPKIKNHPIYKNKFRIREKQIKHYAEYISSEIRLGTNLFKDYDKYIQSIRRQHKSNWMIVSSDENIYKQIYAHEFGHFINDLISRDDEKLFTPELLAKEWKKETIKEYKKITKEKIKVSDIGKLLSDYAMDDNCEMFAEAFAEYYTSSKPRQFASLIGEKIEKALEKYK